LLQVLSITAPMFMVMAIGYIVVRSGMMAASSIPVLGRYVLTVGLPALLFGNLASADLSQVANANFLLAYGLGSLLVFTVGMGVFRQLKGDTLSKSGLQCLGISLSNNAFIGYPLLLQAFVVPPTAAFSMVLLVENLLILPLALAVMTYGHAHEEGKHSTIREVLASVFARVIRHPVVVSIILGLLVSLISLPVSPVVDKTLELLGNTTAGLALFIIGGSLVGQRFDLGFKQGWMVILGKLVVHPLMVMLMLFVFPVDDPALRMAAMMLAAVPMLSVFAIMGDTVGQRGFAASTLLATTITSFFTISLFLWLLGVS